MSSRDGCSADASNSNSATSQQMDISASKTTDLQHNQINKIRTIIISLNCKTRAARQCYIYAAYHFQMQKLTTFQKYAMPCTYYF